MWNLIFFKKKKKKKKETDDSIANNVMDEKNIFNKLIVMDDVV